MFGAATVGRLCLAVLLVGSAAVAAPAAATPTETRAAGASVAETAAVPVAPPANNTTQHRNPATVEESGDLGRVERWLGGRMGELLGRSTLRLSRGEYQRARSLVGRQYDSHLDRYVDVAGDTDSAADDEHADTYAAARETQTAYVSAVKTYRETRDAYEAAKAAGDDARARRLARNLSRQADRVQSLSRNLTALYGSIESFSDTDLAPATERVTDISENVTAATSRIVAAEFVQTRVAVGAAPDDASFTDPLRVRGRVRTPNGTVANGSVVVRLGPQTVRRQVAANGSFDATLRPTLAASGRQSVSVRYRPPAASVYLGANESVAVRIRSVTPSLSVAANRTTVRYGDHVRITATLTANDTAVAGVPAALRFGSRAVATDRTNAAGRLTRVVEVGAAPRAGNRSVTVDLPFEGRAIASTSASTTVRVAPSETAVTLTQDGGAVTGRLTTAAGDPVTGVDVAVTVGDETRVVTTNATGAYRASLPEAAGANRTATVTVRFDGTGTNLASATASRVVTLPAQSSGVGDGQRVLPRVDGVRLAVLGGGALLVGGLLAGGVWYARRIARAREEEAEAADGSESGRASAPAASDGDAEDADPSGSTDARFAVAESLLADGRPTDAVVALYPELRAALAAHPGDDARTHWEFHDAVAARHPDVAARLRSVTEAYEQAAFAADGVDEARARDVLAAAQDVVDAAGVDDTAPADAE